MSLKEAIASPVGRRTNRRSTAPAASGDALVASLVVESAFFSIRTCGLDQKAGKMSCGNLFEGSKLRSTGRTHEFICLMDEILRPKLTLDSTK